MLPERKVATLVATKVATQESTILFDGRGLYAFAGAISESKDATKPLWIKDFTNFGQLTDFSFGCILDVGGH